MRRWLFNRINPLRYKRCFMMTDYRNREVYICFPESGYDWPNMSLAWNWAEDTFHVYDLGGEITFGTHGTIPAPNVSTTFDDESGTFDDDASTFDEATYSQFLTRLLLLDARRQLAYRNDTSESYNSREMPVYARRTGTRLSQNDDSMVRIRRIYPRVTGVYGDVLHFHIGTRETESAPTFWDGPHYYQIGIENWIDLRTVPGRIVDLHIEHFGPYPFRLSGYSVEFDADGRR
jgi:hypothetical protein